MAATKKLALSTAKLKPQSTSSTPKDFEGTFARLKQILVPYAQHFTLAEDTPQQYTLMSVSKNKTPKRFGSVAIRKDHVTFYSCPAILKKGSAKLKKQMQGTSSVNFTAPDEPLMQELDKLTAIRYHDYQTNGWI